MKVIRSYCSYECQPDPANSIAKKLQTRKIPQVRAVICPAYKHKHKTASFGGILGKVVDICVSEKAFTSISRSECGCFRIASR